MASFIINSPVQIFYETDGTPLEDGNIYIGEAGKNPITNPINVFWDAEFNYPAAQPIRTLAGYPSNNGSPGNLYLNDLVYSDYSITVQDKNNNNVLLFSRARSDFTLPHNPSTGFVNVKNFGATGDGTTDDYQSFADALSFMNTNALKVLYVPKGDYVLGTQLTIDDNGVTIMGDGVINTVAVAGPTKLIGSHSAGAVIRIRSENCVIKDLYVGATTARNTGAAGFNFGIHAEGLDNSTGAVRGTIIERVRIAEQPSDGLVMVGEIVSSVVKNCSFDNNDGHGLSINRGESTGRVDNTFAPGICTISNIRCNRNGGHGMALGDPTATSLPTYRLHITEYEGFQNATDAGVRFVNYDTYMQGDNNSIYTSAFGGDTLRGGLYMLGRTLKVFSCRLNSCTQPIEIAYTALSPTHSVLIDGIEVRNVAVSFAIICDSNVRGVRAYSNIGSSTYTALLQAQTDSVYQEDAVINMDSVTITSDSNASFRQTTFSHGTKTATSGTINDDSFVNLSFGESIIGLMTFDCAFGTYPAGMVFVRATASLPGVALVAALNSGILNLTAGALTGTTGPDGYLTISAVSDGVIGFENRLGATIDVKILLIR